MDTREINPNAVGKLLEKYGNNHATSVRQADVLFDDFLIESQNCRYTTKSLKALLMERGKITTGVQS